MILCRCGEEYAYHDTSPPFAAPIPECNGWSPGGTLDVEHAEPTPATTLNHFATL